MAATAATILHLNQNSAITLLIAVTVLHNILSIDFGQVVVVVIVAVVSFRFKEDIVIVTIIKVDYTDYQLVSFAISNSFTILICNYCMISYVIENIELKPTLDAVATTAIIDAAIAVDDSSGTAVTTTVDDHLNLSDYAFVATVAVGISATITNDATTTNYSITATAVANL